MNPVYILYTRGETVSTAVSCVSMLKPVASVHRNQIELHKRIMHSDFSQKVFSLLAGVMKVLTFSLSTSR